MLLVDAMVDLMDGLKVALLALHWVDCWVDYLVASLVYLMDMRLDVSMVMMKVDQLVVPMEYRLVS